MQPRIKPPRATPSLDHSTERVEGQRLLPTHTAQFPTSLLIGASQFHLHLQETDNFHTSQCGRSRSRSRAALRCIPPHWPPLIHLQATTFCTSPILFILLPRAGLCSWHGFVGSMCGVVGIVLVAGWGKAFMRSSTRLGCRAKTFSCEGCNLQFRRTVRVDWHKPDTKGIG